MYRPILRIDSPAQNSVFAQRKNAVTGYVNIPRAQIQIFVRAGTLWYPQGVAFVNGKTWDRVCRFGDEQSASGEYAVVAIANGDIDMRKNYKTLPERGVRSNEVSVTLRKGLT